MAPSAPQIDRLKEKLRLETPIMAVYDSPPSQDFEPLIRATGRTCCFAYYKRWLKGETLVIERGNDSFHDPQHGCPGAQNAFGLSTGYPDFMAHFLTDGKGAPMGEGLKATPELAQEFLDRAKPPLVSGDTVLIGPLRPDQWDTVKSVTFLVDPDRLAGVLTLAGYWTSDPNVIYAPFSSGCGLLWRELENEATDRAIIGGTDLAMRRYLPSDTLCVTVSPARFEEMVGFPNETFLNRSWWNELMDQRASRMKGRNVFRFPTSYFLAL